MPTLAFGAATDAAGSSFPDSCLDIPASIPTGAPIRSSMEMGGADGVSVISDGAAKTSVFVSFFLSVARGVDRLALNAIEENNRIMNV